MLFDAFTGINYEQIRHDTQITSTKIVEFSRPPIPLVYLCPKFFHPLDFGRPIPNKPPSLNDNQLVKRKHPRMTINDFYMLPGSSFRSAFVFSLS